MIALDGYPLGTNQKSDPTILVPPAGRAEFIVQAPSSGNAMYSFVTKRLQHRSDGNADIC